MNESKIAVVLGSRKEEQQLRDIIKVDSRLELSEQLRDSCLLQPKEINIDNENLEISNNLQDFNIIISTEHSIDIEEVSEFAINSDGFILIPPNELDDSIDKCKELIEPENGPILVPDKQDELSKLKSDVRILTQNVYELTRLVKELIHK